MASAGLDQTSEVHFRRGPCKIILKKGDLLRETNVDALVIPTPSITESEKHNYALFNSICSTANHDLKRQIEITREKVDLSKPQFIWKKDSSYILSVPPYLGNPKKAEEFLEKTYTSCLALAMKFDVQKIAFPTIGCGDIGFRPNDAAKIVYRLLEKFELPNRTKLNEIRVVIYNIDVYGIFTQTFMELSQDNKTRIKFDTMYVIYSRLVFCIRSSTVDCSFCRDVSASEFIFHVIFRLDRSTAPRGMGSGGDTKQSPMDDS